ncbi:MAG: hypothetical protein OIN86_04085 [Candidatus Methanoperedens sp.]|nr:hypothetical protein [Candidatus Methanoperedens sp.]CAG0988543.1 hypothetical protein METP1_02168 [Methanosarcinales archaeon]
MKSDIKKKSRYIINICLILLIFTSVSIAQALVSADRTIEKNALTAGSETSITIIIKNDNTQLSSIALEESIPPGWNLTRISDDADVFRTATNEWVWYGGNNTDKNVKYKINIPSGTAPGTYMINGKIKTSNTTINVTGYNTIKVSGSVSGGSSSGSSIDGTPTITPVKSANATASQTETVTAQPTVTIGKQTSVAPIETDIAPTNTKSPGFGIIISIGIFAAIYIMRRMK